MEFKDYKVRLMNEIRGKIGENIVIEEISYVKNNDKDRDGIVIQTGKIANPVICLDRYYIKFCDGEKINAQVDEISRIVLSENVEVENMCKILLKDSWEEAKDKVSIEVINQEWNKTKLENVPYVKLLNLAVIFRFMINEITSCVITNEMLKRWNITEDTLIEAAFLNMKETKFTIKKVADVLREKMGVDLSCEEIDECPLYIMSNESQVFGASGLVRKDLLKEFVHKIGKDIFVLPSSIHEVLLVPATDEVEVEYLKEMVKCVNESSVDKADWLSDNIYFFGRDKAKLEIAA